MVNPNMTTRRITRVRKSLKPKFTECDSKITGSKFQVKRILVRFYYHNMKL
jgi:hypothetical protein